MEKKTMTSRGSPAQKSRQSRNLQMRAAAVGCLSATALGVVLMGLLALAMSAGRVPIWATKGIGLLLGCVLAAAAAFFLCQMLGAERILSGAVVCSHSVFRLLFDFPELGRGPVLARAGQAVFHADLRLCVREPRRQSPFGKTGLKKAGAILAPAFVTEWIIPLWWFPR